VSGYGDDSREASRSLVDRQALIAPTYLATADQTIVSASLMIDEGDTNSSSASLPARRAWKYVATFVEGYRILPLVRELDGDSSRTYLQASRPGEWRPIAFSHEIDRESSHLFSVPLSAACGYLQRPENLLTVSAPQLLHL
ncbi:hypothetical protein LTR39_006468, partial [Cryomyces antarcticus]